MCSTSAVTTDSAAHSRLVRGLWTLFEPLHAIVYGSPETVAAYGRAGLPGGWGTYCAVRTAPLGRIQPAAVTAIFNSFEPTLIDAAMAGAWDAADPVAVLEARASACGAALRRLFLSAPSGARPDAAMAPDEVLATAEALEGAVARLVPAGRPLGAANAALPTRVDPHERLWQSATTLREHRGDSHVAALTSLGIAGLPSVLLRVGSDMTRRMIQRRRGWSDEQWADGLAQLIGDGLLAPAGGDVAGLEGSAEPTVTAAGADLLRQAEAMTDRSADAPWSQVDIDVLHRIGLRLAAQSASTATEVPHPNPVGAPAKWDPRSDPDATLVPISPAD
jgi:hypothetical protein